MPRERLLHAVEPATEPPVDIGRLMRADRDDPERWRRVHEECQRRKPLSLGELRKRLWRG
jgi:hypothetical protein